MSASRPSSRDSSAGAGWENCSGPGDWISDVPAGTKPNSWLRPSTLWNSRNDIVAKHVYDPVDRARVEWVRLARERADATGGDPDFIIHRGEEPFSFLLLGDPGEGDNSQYAVVPPLIAESEGTDFTVICSDVIYPAGELADYRNKFFRPYRNLDCPIYAVPGNHDWYDGLHGFMSHLCGIDTPQAPLKVGPGVRGWLAKQLWRRTNRPSDDDIATMRADRSRPKQFCDPAQPGPYWAIDAGPVRIVGIDTGIVGTLDVEQAAWLRRVSLSSDRPKILITGKPLIVNGHWTSEQRRRDIAEVVADPAANYVAVIGGDTHNYQRYPVKHGERTIQYVVAGGGGAYTHATHQIPRVELIDEDDFRCYPLRSDSLARFSQLYDAKFAGGKGRLTLSSAEAATYLSDLLQLTPTREQRVPLSRRARFAAKLLQPAPSASGFHRFASEYFDWNDPPFFKQFLRVDVGDDELTVRCFGVTGCRDAVTEPPVEDSFSVRF